MHGGWTLIKSQPSPPLLKLILEPTACLQGALCELKKSVMVSNMPSKVFVGPKSQSWPIAFPQANSIAARALEKSSLG